MNEIKRRTDAYWRRLWLVVYCIIVAKNGTALTAGTQADKAIDQFDERYSE